MRLACWCIPRLPGTSTDRREIRDICWVAGSLGRPMLRVVTPQEAADPGAGDSPETRPCKESQQDGGARGGMEARGSGRGRPCAVHAGWSGNFWIGWSAGT